MITTAAVLQMPGLGVHVELRRTAADTDGEYIEFDVVGRARGFLAVEHVHLHQTEHYEVIEGVMRLRPERTLPADTPSARILPSSAGGSQSWRAAESRRCAATES